MKQPKTLFYCTEGGNRIIIKRLNGVHNQHIRLLLVYRLQHFSQAGLRKNRFGATNEIGVFEMGDGGLTEVENPSKMLLSGRPEEKPGTCVTCVMGGARPDSWLTLRSSPVSPTSPTAARSPGTGL